MQNTNENTNNVKHVAVSRIQLAYKIRNNEKKLGKKINFQLLRMFKMGPPINCIPRGDCVYYAPHVPNGICRFCHGFKTEHKISERLVLKYYIPKIIPLYESDYY